MITRENIIERASMLQAVHNALSTMQGAFVRMQRGEVYLEYWTDEREPVLLYHKDGETHSVHGDSRTGERLTIVEPTPSQRWLMEAFAKDSELFDLYKRSRVDHRGRVCITVQHVSHYMDFDEMCDEFGSEITYTIGKDGRVYAGKPQPYTRSVLVALNID